MDLAFILDRALAVAAGAVIGGTLIDLVWQGIFSHHGMDHA